MRPGCPSRCTTRWRRGSHAVPCSCRRRGAGTPPSVACERCRTPARCAVCTGPLGVPGPTAPPACRWCGTVVDAWALLESADTAASGLRWWVSGVPPRSWAAPSLDPGRGLGRRPRGGARCRIAPAVVVATPGAEPVAAAGYAAVILLDTWLALARPDLRTDEEALRRWLGAAGSWSPRAVTCSWSATRPTRHSRRSSAGTPPGSPGARRRPGPRRTCRRPAPARHDHR